MNTAAPTQPGQETEALAESPSHTSSSILTQSYAPKLPVSLSLGLPVGFESGAFLSAQPWLD